MFTCIIDIISIDEYKMYKYLPIESKCSNGMFQLVYTNPKFIVDGKMLYINKKLESINSSLYKDDNGKFLIVIDIKDINKFIDNQSIFININSLLNDKALDRLIKEFNNFLSSIILRNI
ncbi:hypothetical protein FPHOBKDP_00073 [Listeria phage LPJP1]|nr:hypothetical protein FPHOBKDP_00073 [Listeria phage LPJP1]